MPNYIVNPHPSTGSGDSEYAIKRNEAIVKEIPEKDKFNWQTHHDHYVKKYREAISSGIQLNQVELGQYELAMLRERQGYVKPLP